MRRDSSGDDRIGRALVTDASERVALHVIRCLGRAGIPAVATEVLERVTSCPSFASRHTISALVVDEDPQGSGRAEQLASCGVEGDVLVPVCLNSLLFAINNIGKISTNLLTLLPSQETLLRANDKWALHRVAQTAGVAAPRSWCPADATELHETISQMTLPAIVKLRHDQNVYLGPSERYTKVSTTDALVSAWHRFADIQPRPLVQEYVSGSGYGFEALYDREHRCVASFQHRRLVECPPQGGPSAVCESVRVPELEEYGRRLLDELKWTGVAMVEFRRCAITGRFYLLEINPRFWGSVALSEAAGVNFPALYYHCARGEKVEAPTYREGVRLRLMPTYLLSGLISLRQGPRGVWEALSNLRYLFDPRVREGLITLDDLSGSWAYIRRKMARGSTDG